jgi:hypothetical protein
MAENKKAVAHDLEMSIFVEFLVSDEGENLYTIPDVQEVIDHLHSRCVEVSHADVGSDGIVLTITDDSYMAMDYIKFNVEAAVNKFLQDIP